MTNTFSHEEELRRARLISKMGWDDIDQARLLIERGAFKGWSRQRLEEQYKALCDLIPQTNVIQASNHIRIDDGFIEWLGKYGAQAKAIERLLSERRVS